MISFLLLAALCTSHLAYSQMPQMPQPDHYSYSPAVGRGDGTSFSTEGQGRITGIRIWESSGDYITGIQVRYDFIWSAVAGREVGTAQELILFDGESIVQVSGKYNPSNYIYQLLVMTSGGRSLLVGQPVQTSFNFYPTHQNAELLLLSGRFNGAGITSLGAHWGVYMAPPGNSSDNSS